MTTQRDRIAITVGEPAGIGPDIVLGLADRDRGAELVAIADPDLLRQRAAALGMDISLVETGPDAPAAPHIPGTLSVLPVRLEAPCSPGLLDARNAAYVLATLELATRACQAGQFAAMVTAPVQKSIINEAGFPFSGHTEFLADLTGTEHVVMMLASDRLRVALVTTHLPLSAVPAAITPELLQRTLSTLDRDLRSRFGIAEPRLAVLGLNPHAGESGHLGREEIEIIIPTLQRAQRAGLQLSGPLPADTAFSPSILDHHDAIVAMYHDQGLPVLKYAGFGNAVNITLGLPIIRTSVDHGTALDLAGTGRASTGSLATAVSTTVQMIGSTAPG